MVKWGEIIHFNINKMQNKQREINTASATIFLKIHKFVFINEFSSKDLQLI